MANTGDLSARLSQLSTAKRELLEKRMRGEAADSAPDSSIPRNPNQEAAPLSFTQQRLWFLHQLEPDSAAYNIPLAFMLEGTLDETALTASLDALVVRHAVLRTSFPLHGSEPQQHVAPSLTLPLAVHDLHALPPAERDTAAHDLLHASATQPFDLATGPLLRGLLLHLAPDRHLFALTLHHSICDEWSLAIFLRELGTLYGAFQAHTPSPLPPLPIQYTDFTHWQRAQFAAPRMQQHLAYWTAQLANLPTLALPTDAPRPPLQSFHGASELLTVPAALSTALRQLSQAEGSSLFMSVLAAWQVLLSRYSGQRDIVVGTPIAGRTHTEIEHLMGPFLNLLVIRTDLRGQPSFRQVVRRVREVALAAYEHQELPFEKLVEEIQPERDPSRNPLFQVLFDFHNVGTTTLALSGLTVHPFDTSDETAKLDISLTMWEEGEGLAGRLLYNTDLFTAATIRRLRDHFLVLLESCVTQPDLPITRLPLLTPAEHTELLHTRNHTAAPFPSHLALHQAIEAQVVRTPTAPALVAGSVTLTYADLNAQANQLAHTLVDRGVRPGDRVALCTSPTPAMLVALLAILKTGAAFVPLDPAFPPERLHYILADAAVTLVVTEHALAARFPATVPVLCLDRDAATWADAPTTNLPPTVDGDALAYLIYTSGSTGRPKGVLIPHRGILNYLLWCADAYGAARGRGAPVQASIAADAIFPSLFAPLLVGRAVLLLNAVDPLPALATALATDGDFSFIKITPSQLEVLEHYLPRPPAAAWVHTLVVGAEAVRREVLRSWQQHAPTIPLLNEYGPTETVVGCSVYPIPPTARFSGAAPLGLPIANLTFYVLDQHMQPVPVGVPGELYIGGVGVAWGYHQRPELTADKFVPDPFSAEPGGRLYRSGDVVRYLADPTANLAFLGRSDDQVKIRGYRVELGEVEAALDTHPQVREVVVLARPHGGTTRLVAYVVLDGAMPSVSAWRQFLQAQLPEYMLPQVFVRLDAIPLAPHGKIDRAALPLPDMEPERDTAYTAPSSPLETQLATIWSQVLAVPSVGVHDNFFLLGGHSLLATQVVARARDAFQVEVSIRNLFEAPTVAGLAEVILQLQIGQADDQDLADLLAEIEQLSASEALSELRHSTTGNEGVGDE